MNPNDVYRELTEAGTDWADKVGAAEMLEMALKSLKAQLSLEAKNAEGCSMTEAESISLASSRYRDMAKNAVNARTEANRARVRYDSAKSLFEARRTAEASERAALRAAP